MAFLTFNTRNIHELLKATHGNIGHRSFQRIFIFLPVLWPFNNVQRPRMFATLCIYEPALNTNHIWRVPCLRNQRQERNCKVYKAKWGYEPGFVPVWKSSVIKPTLINDPSTPFLVIFFDCCRQTQASRVRYRRRRDAGLQQYFVRMVIPVAAPFATSSQKPLLMALEPPAHISPSPGLDVHVVNRSRAYVKPGSMRLARRFVL